MRPHPDVSGPSSPVRYERRGAAALLTIDRPERRNAVDGPTAKALHEAYLHFEADEDARVLVLTGAGGVAFCAGADLKAIETFGDRLTAPEGPMGFTRLTPSKPTIAAISGFALAGGLELALWCDLRIATTDSRLGFPERRWGVPLIDGGTQRLPRVVGLGRALDLILTGRIMDAAEAHAWGLVNELVPRRPPRAGTGARRGPGTVPPAHDARRPQRRDPRAWHLPPRRPRAGGPGRPRRVRGRDPRGSALRGGRGPRGCGSRGVNVTPARGAAGTGA